MNGYVYTLWISSIASLIAAIAQLLAVLWHAP